MCDGHRAATDSVAASWTISSEEDACGYTELRDVLAIWICVVLSAGPAYAGRPSGRAEPGTDAGPAAPACGAALILKYSSIRQPGRTDNWTALPHRSTDMAECPHARRGDRNP